MAKSIYTTSGSSVAGESSSTPHISSVPKGADPLAGNTWREPGPAAFDFRSDVVTRPTARMLEAIAQTSLLDDDLGEDPEVNALQERVARLTAHEAGLLVMSGTMGNQVSIRSHLTQPPFAVLCDHRAHILTSEGGGASTWSGAMIQSLVPRNGRYLTLEDVKEHAVLEDDIYYCPTRLISLENTLNGIIMPLNETRRICEWAHAHGIKVHLDGARLWDAAIAGAGSVTDYARLFDSVSVCFSKGLGAPIGSMVVGSHAFIKKVRWCRKAMGGGTRQGGVIAAAARIALEDTFGGDDDAAAAGEKGRQLRRSQENARQIASMWTSKGGELANPTETSMVWLDLEAMGIPAAEWDELGRKEGLKLMAGRLVVHYQISEEAIQKLERVMDAALTGRAEQMGSK